MGPALCPKTRATTFEEGDESTWTSYTSKSLVTTLRTVNIPHGLLVHPEVWTTSQPFGGEVDH